MKNMNLRGLLSAICVASVLAGFTRMDAAPVRFDQVVQIMNVRPGTAETGTFSRLRVAGDYTFLIDADGDDDKKIPPPQDGRVITETKTEIVTDDVCDCVQEDVSVRRGFPKWALLGLAAIPIAFILIRRDKDTPTPTPRITPTPTPGMTPTPTPGITPTPTPGMTPTPTPHMTPTPPPEPVPEPMTILLFGTGLASVGMAARRRFGKKGESSDEKEEE
jgi:hypothetical protein